MKVLRKYFSFLIIFCSLFLFSMNVAAEEFPDITSIFTGTKTDTGENVTTGKLNRGVYFLEVPLGSVAEKVILPVDTNKLQRAVLHDLDEEGKNTSLWLYEKNGAGPGEDTYNEEYYDATAKTLTIPMADMFWQGTVSAPYLNLGVDLYGYSVFCRYASPAKTFDTSRETGYVGGDEWINVAATFDTESPLIKAETPVKLYIVNKDNGKEADAVSEITETTVGDISPTVKFEEKKAGVMAKDLEAGDYYVVLQTIAGDTEDKIDYQYVPYKVYATVKEYVKAALDNAIDFYQTPPTLAAIDDSTLTLPQKAFYNANKNKYPGLSGKRMDRGGYFYNVTSLVGAGYTFNYPEYVGISANSGDLLTGVDWQAWIFPALGSSYPYVDNDGNTKKLDFSLDGNILSNGKSGADKRTYLNRMYEYLQRKGWKTAQNMNLGSKDGFRYIAALCALGADPRNPFPGQEYNPNLLEGYISAAYQRDTISWNEDGSLNLEEAKLNLDDKGALYLAGMDDVLFRSYFILALEIANASPEEGYTDALREAGIKGVLPTGQNFVKGIMPDDDPASSMFPIDVATMSMLPLCFMTDDPVYGEDIRAMLAKLPEAVSSAINKNEYGFNANSLAVALNTIICAGYTADDLQSKVYQGTYQTVLNSLVANQLDNGGFAYVKAEGVNVMATYQAVGALVDIYNSKNTLKSANENYLYKYPQYTDTGHQFTAYLNSLPGDAGDLQWDEVPTVIVARNTYEALFQSLDKSQRKRLPDILADKLAVLADLEGNTGTVVGKEMGRLPDKDEVKLADRPHVQAVRAAYDSLSEAQKNIANGENNANISKLWGAERGLDQWDAKEVSNLILSLPSPDDITALDRADIEAARAAYEALSKEEQLLVDGTTLKVLRDAERALVMLDAKNVSKAIDDLPNAADVRVTDKDSIVSARGSYEALTADQKTLVTNYSRLQRAEAVLAELLKAADLDAAAAQAVSDRINALPVADAVAVKDKDAIEGARAAYDKLTDTQKALVPAEALDKLAVVEKALQDLGGQETGRPIDKMVDLKDPSAWYYEPIAKCMDEGLFKGDNNNQFNPQNNITRAEFAQVLYNYYKDDETIMKTGEGKTFNDVQAGKWYYEAIDACAKAGLIAGDDKGNFNPDKPILRQDVALIMMRLSIGADAIEALDVDALLQDLANQNLSFSDFPTTSPYAQKAMAAAAGVIFFGNDGKLQPQSNITRAEMAQVMYNFLFK